MMIQACVDYIKRTDSGLVLLLAEDKDVRHDIMTKIVTSADDSSFNVIVDEKITTLEGLFKMILRQLDIKPFKSDIIMGAKHEISKLRYKIVVYEEDIDVMLTDMKDDLHMLRSIIQSDQSLLIVGTIKGYFDEITDMDRPFYRGAEIFKF